MQKITEKLLKCSEVQEQTALSKPTVYRKMNTGEFPRPLRIGSCTVRWKQSDITGWIDSLISTSTRA